MLGVIVVGILASIAISVVLFVPGIYDSITTSNYFRKVSQACHEFGMITLIKVGRKRTRFNTMQSFSPRFFSQVVFSFYQVILLVQDIYGTVTLN